MTKIIGIGGVSRSGKSSLAEELAKSLYPKRTLILSQDDYVNPEFKIPTIKDRTDWEHPDSINLQGIVDEIARQRTKYEFIIIEGLLAFYFSELHQLYDLKIQCVISKEIFLKRRRAETRWGPEPEWFIDHVWNSYLHYGQTANADFEVSGVEQANLRSIIEALG